MSNGKSELHDLLCHRLAIHDTYSLERVNGIPHTCDSIIKRVGFHDVCLEVKTHGEHTGAKVGKKETVRFRKDLLTMSSHGIFVSLYNDICGKGKVDFEVLQNCKIAVFLSSNNHDVNIIFDVVQLIYHMDSMLEAAHSAVHPTHMKFTLEDMKCLKSELHDIEERVHTTQKETTSIVKKQRRKIRRGVLSVSQEDREIFHAFHQRRNGNL